MLVPISWLKEYVDIDLTPEALAETLTLGGLEVEGITHIGEGWARDKVMVGQVLGVRQHPQADRLVLANVEYGADEPLEVVTGAPNLHVGDRGQKVVLALVGARLIDGHAEGTHYTVLKRGKIRGIESAGMVCSEKELGVSDEHTGIVILPDDAPVGKPLADYWGETVLDITLEANMARCLSVLGVAREVAALTGKTLKRPEQVTPPAGTPIDGHVAVQIADPDLCLRYSASLIRNVEIRPSPEWMQRRLALAGMRPINNVVDITNYVMLEIGQPLHAFDYHQVQPLAGGSVPTIVVRRAHPGETMTTLDGNLRQLNGDMLLITDGSGPVAIAGVMGGLESEITAQTHDILLEAANFQYINNRKTAGALKIPSEASYRFGRGVDPELTLVALERAISLLYSYGGGTPAQDYVDVYPGRTPDKVIDFRVSEVKRLLGLDLSAAEVAGLLRSLEFSCEELPGNVLRVGVPSYRLDVTISADLVEEVARLYGYDNLPTTLIDDQMPSQIPSRDLALEEHLRDVLVGVGLAEIITYSITSLESVAKLSPEGALPDPAEYIRLVNPLSSDHEYMRRTLMNTSLETLAANLRYQERAALFEIGNIYLRTEAQRLPDQPRRLSVALAGARAERSWLGQSDAMDFYDLKGVLEVLNQRFGVSTELVRSTHPSFHPGKAVDIVLDGAVIGVMGEVHPTVVSAFEIEAPHVGLLELDLEAFLGAAGSLIKFKPISRMPRMSEDLALVVAEDVRSDEVERTIREAGGALLADVVLFDVYRNAQLGAGRKSLAYNLTYQAPDRTLTTEQSAKLRERILRQVAQRHQAELRA
ncbi:MAG: phenylalanine--tRNA ligase subunit beta [Chloroflexi bacterium]|nr:phenylalanine--tRNA ligase subunit beta [Chloroflexota bacterium]